ncbi:hypothetical protein FRC20_004585 [Serendipita sp. 405]|nr:hypothetical protein FRC16_004404 [Serendipita sp. 398]KAG8842188.1 hypothetical protein FRC20_004585 [Serendipita sp. 405]
MRKLYPDIVFGAIASSAVTYATINNWEYMDIIRTAAPQACSTLIQSSMTQIDSLLANSTLRTPLKALFGLRGLQHDDDFVSVLSWPLGSFQGKNWDPKVGSTGFEEFCAKLVDEDDIDAMESEREATRLGLPVDLVIFRYAKYIRALVDQLCPNTEEQEDCFGTHNASKFQGTSLQETWRLWIFQVCTEWGYFIPAPPDPEWPSMISRLIDLEFESKICRQAFPPGKHMTIPMWPNVTVVNELGGFGLTYPRLAFIDGEIDPWRPCTPHSRWAPPRNDTISKPFKLIPGGVHHHDQNGLRKHKKEPKHIQEIHREEIEFVQAWLKEWIPK